MMVACENGQHHVVSTILRELRTAGCLEEHKKVLCKNKAKVCAHTIPVVMHVILHKSIVM